jgi:hypothetical protein
VASKSFWQQPESIQISERRGVHEQGRATAVTGVDVRFGEMLLEKGQVAVANRLEQRSRIGCGKARGRERGTNNQCNEVPTHACHSLPAV